MTFRVNAPVTPGVLHSCVLLAHKHLRGWQIVGAHDFREFHPRFMTLDLFEAPVHSCDSKLHNYPVFEVPSAKWVETPEINDLVAGRKTFMRLYLIGRTILSVRPPRDLAWRMCRPPLPRVAPAAAARE